MLGNERGERECNLAHGLALTFKETKQAKSRLGSFFIFIFTNLMLCLHLCSSFPLSLSLSYQHDSKCAQCSQCFRQNKSSLFITFYSLYASLVLQVSLDSFHWSQAPPSEDFQLRYRM